MKNILLVTVLFTFACAEDLSVEGEISDTDFGLESVVSICYNKGSKEHGKRCSPDCFERGNQSTFCWDIYREDCKAHLTSQWQR